MAKLKKGGVRPKNGKKNDETSGSNDVVSIRNPLPGRFPSEAFLAGLKAVAKIKPKKK